VLVTSRSWPTCFKKARVPFMTTSESLPSWLFLRYAAAHPVLEFHQRQNSHPFCHVFWFSRQPRPVRHPPSVPVNNLDPVSSAPVPPSAS
jgi:hypothetical protein